MGADGDGAAGQGQHGRPQAARSGGQEGVVAQRQTGGRGQCGKADFGSRCDAGIATDREEVELVDAAEGAADFKSKGRKDRAGLGQQTAGADAKCSYGVVHHVKTRASKQRQAGRASDNTGAGVAGATARPGRKGGAGADGDGGVPEAAGQSKGAAVDRRGSGVDVRAGKNDGAGTSCHQIRRPRDDSGDSQGVRRVIGPRLIGTQSHVGGDQAGGNAGVDRDPGGRTGRCDGQRIAVGVEAQAIRGIRDRQGLDRHIGPQDRGGRGGRDHGVRDGHIGTRAGNQGLNGSAGGCRPVAAGRAVGGRPDVCRARESAFPEGSGQRRRAGDRHLQIRRGVR